jgi:hypothetical protein
MELPATMVTGSFIQFITTHTKHKAHGVRHGSKAAMSLLLCHEDARKVKSTDRSGRYSLTQRLPCIKTQVVLYDRQAGDTANLILEMRCSGRSDASLYQPTTMARSTERQRSGKN